MPELNSDPPEVRQALAGLAAEMASLEAPPLLEALLLQAYRARRRRFPLSKWTVAGAAALAAAAVVAAFLPQWTPVHKLPPPRLVHARPAAIELITRRPPAPLAPRRPAMPRRALAAARPATRPSTPTREIASDFFPLWPGPLIEPGEFASLVRVSVPRSEMRRFGLITGSEMSGAVQADVVIGQDGMARAVRFVSAPRR